MKKNYTATGEVVVLYGGNSPERAVSLESGRAVYDALQKAGVPSFTADTAREDLIPLLLERKPARAFIALHGQEGEDGTIQGLLEFTGIPYTGSDVRSSALTMDKYRTKLIWRAAGLPTPEFVLTSPGNIPEEYPFPCFVKATCQGSTIGTFPVTSRAELRGALGRAAPYGREILIEKRITGREITVPVLNGKALPPIWIEPESGFYDYDAKYLTDTTRYHIPCGLSSGKEQELQALALQAFHLTGCSGWGRVDFMEDRAGAFWLIEINTIPGMTSHSLVPQSARAAGMTFTQLVLAVLDTARLHHRLKKEQYTGSPLCQAN